LLGDLQQSLKNNIKINSEEISLNFPKGSAIWFPEEYSFFSHNERYYSYEKIDSISKDRFAASLL